MRPTIAVMPLVDDERESLWMLPGYMDALREAGAVPFMPAVTTDDDEIQQIFAMCDGLLMTGGHDVEPRQYGGSQGSTTSCRTPSATRWSSRCCASRSRMTNPSSGYAEVCRS